MVATSFIGIYHIVIDTILLCYCEDMNGNNGSSEYTPEPIKKVINKCNNDLKQTLISETSSAAVKNETNPTIEMANEKPVNLS